MINLKRVHRLIAKFEKTGCVKDAPKCEAPKVVTNDENMDLVAAAYVQSPRKSKASSELQISRRSLGRIMTEIGLKPFRPRLLQALNDDDPDRRQQFCKEFLSLYHLDSNIVDEVIWTDEATFKLNGRINRHYSVYWADENPHEILRKLICWASQSGERLPAMVCLIGPFFFDKTVNAQNYEEMLKTKLWPLLRDCQNVNELFQQDGAPPHYGLSVRQWLNDHFSMDQPPRANRVATQIT